MSDLHFEMTMSQRGHQKRYQGGHCRRLLWACMPEVSAALKKRESPGWIWVEGEKQSFRWAG